MKKKQSKKFRILHYAKRSGMRDFALTLLDDVFDTFEEAVDFIQNKTFKEISENWKNDTTGQRVVAEVEEKFNRAIPASKDIKEFQDIMKKIRDDANREHTTTIEKYYGHDDDYIIRTYLGEDIEWDTRYKIVEV